MYSRAFSGLGSARNVSSSARCAWLAWTLKPRSLSAAPVDVDGSSVCAGTARRIAMRANRTTRDMMRVAGLVERSAVRTGAVAALGLARRDRLTLRASAAADHARRRQELLQIGALAGRAGCGPISGHERLELP